jgi:S1-C subfamily serine protease
MSVPLSFALGILPFAFCLPSSAQNVAAQPPRELGPAQRAVVQLLAIGPGAGDKKQECAATGFFVNDEGYILTNAHVVDDARRCLASSPGAKIVAKFGPGDGRTAEAVACDVVGMDVDHDLAVLKTESPLPLDVRGAFLRLEAKPVPDGTRVAVTGHPSFTWQPKSYQGKVIGREALALNDRSNRPSDVIVITIPLQRGASGSPVYLESGGVVGIVERQRPSRREDTVAVPVGCAIRLLDLHGIRWHPAN